MTVDMAQMRHFYSENVLVSLLSIHSMPSQCFFFTEIEAIEVIHLLQSAGLLFLKPWAFKSQWHSATSGSWIHATIDLYHLHYFYTCKLATVVVTLASMLRWFCPNLEYNWRHPFVQVMNSIRSIHVYLTNILLPWLAEYMQSVPFTLLINMPASWN